MRSIVIDVYGADAGVAPIVQGTIKALKESPDFRAIFVGDSEAVRPLLEEAAIDPALYELVHTDGFIPNDAPPTAVFGGNDDASMVMAYDRLKTDDNCMAMLSAGNTGALLVGSICRLGLIKGMKFPALSSALPCMADHLVCLVDCGGNMEAPRVGLLSVGREDQKGNALTKETFARLKELPLNFIGNVEGYDLITGDADVIVSDGFAGNLILKCAESAGKAAMAIAASFGESDESKALIARINRRLFEVFDYNSQGGATFLGTKKTVVKMHGGANDETAYACIKQIMRLHRGGYAEAIGALEL